MRTSDEYGTEILAMLQNNQIDRRKVGGAIIASVVPKVMHALIGAVVRYLHTEPLIVGSWNQNRHQDHFREPQGNRTGQNCGRSRRL